MGQAGFLEGTSIPESHSSSALRWRFAAQAMTSRELPTAVRARLVPRAGRAGGSAIGGGLGLDGIHGGLDSAIARGLAYAPYSDLIWCETS